MPYPWRIILFFGLLLAVLLISIGTQARTLRICADPNNLPFSNNRREGFENKIAELIAEEIEARPVYTWWAQRRGFLRHTLNAGHCDLVAGSAYGVEAMRASRPYYRSGYVFVTRDGGPKVKSLNDPILRSLRIGVQLVGDDGTNPPPIHALARRNIIENVRGYSVYGDYRDRNPAASIVTAVAHGEIDVAIVWGPVAGFFASKQEVPLQWTWVLPQVDGPQLPLVFDVVMGVHKDNAALRDEINSVLVRLRPTIERILTQYGVPQLNGSTGMR
jgi:mxaJ protein